MSKLEADVNKSTTDSVVEVSTKEKPKNNDEYDIDALYEDAFARKDKDPYISVILWGPEEAGKTYTALTFPGDIDYIDLDGGLDTNLKYYLDKDNNPTKVVKRWRCIDLKDDLENIESGEYDGFKVDPINTLRNFDVVVTQLQKKEGGTVIVDTMTAYNEYLKALMDSRIPKHISAKTGEEYVDQFDWKYVNQKWLWTWEKLKNIRANLVVVAKAKFIYQNREITDQVEPDLRTNTQYQTSVIAEYQKVIKQDGEKITTQRKASFSKFRGNKLGSTYSIEDLTYEKIMKILKEEKQV